MLLIGASYYMYHKTTMFRTTKSLLKENKMRIGIDIGGMTVKLGLVDGAKIVAKKVIETNSEKLSSENVVKNIAVAAMELLQENNSTLLDCEAVGIACPGTVDSNAGVVLYSNNIAWENVPILELFERYITSGQDLELSSFIKQIPTLALANDADAAALGEVLYGAAKGKSNAILLTLGTGVGGGVVMGKKIFSGYMRGGCEPGHMVIDRNGKQCTCGRKGCLEMYASATALMEMAREAAREHKVSLMNELCENDMTKLNGKMIFDAQKQGDAAAVKVIDTYEENLSIGITNLVNIFRPELVILGGGVSAQKEYLTDALQERVDKMCFGADHGEVPHIVTSQLGNDAGIIGAAYLK